jgi:hypothetical protein
MIDIRDLINRDCGLSELVSTPSMLRQLTSILNGYPSDSNSSICCHLYGSQAATLVALLAQLRGAVCK